MAESNLGIESTKCSTEVQSEALFFTAATEQSRPGCSYGRCQWFHNVGSENGEYENNQKHQTHWQCDRHQ